jgi:hypothetical protein
MLLLKLCSEVQLLPMDGSPASSPIPGGEGKMDMRAVPEGGGGGTTGFGTSAPTTETTPLY